MESRRTIHGSTNGIDPVLKGERYAGDLDLGKTVGVGVGQIGK